MSEQAGLVVARCARWETVLLIKEGAHDEELPWALPRLTQRAGETLAEAAITAVREQTNYAICPNAVRPVPEGVYVDKEGRGAYVAELYDHRNLSWHGSLPGRTCDFRGIETIHELARAGMLSDPAILDLAEYAHFTSKVHEIYLP